MGRPTREQNCGKH